MLRQSGLFGATGYAGGFLYVIKSGRLVAAPTLLHYSVGKACHQVVHFLIAADIVRPVQNILLLGLAQVRITVHGGGIGRQRQAETDGKRAERVAAVGR